MSRQPTSCQLLLFYVFVVQALRAAAWISLSSSRASGRVRRVVVGSICSCIEGDDRSVLTRDEILRYSRHLTLSEIGMQGQRLIKSSSVLCVGAGGLGSPLLLYLAAAGVGRIGIIDHDHVDVSNLQRQIIHGEPWIGRSKVDSAAQRMRELNPHIEIDMYKEQLCLSNVANLLAPYDVIVDGSDNFATRFLVNDACVILGKPLVYGAILRFQGQVSVFNYKGGPNYRDLLPQQPPTGAVPSCAEGGVLGVLPGVIGSLQATEALKLITGTGDVLSGRLLIYDALAMSFREARIMKDLGRPPIRHLSSEAASMDSKPSEAAADGFQSITVAEAAQRLACGWTPYVLDVRMPHEAEIVQLPFNSHLCPHREVASISDHIPRDQDVLVYCKGGARSKEACAVLAGLGFNNIVNLEGGILAWAREIDLQMPVY